jgi:GWxTD domain-containing protein
MSITTYSSYQNINAMKKIILSLFILMGTAQATFAIDASVSYATFKGMGQSYIEIYTHIAGQTVLYQPVDDSTYQAGVEVVILFKQNGEIVKFDKFNLNSPISKQYLDFVDIKRYGLDNGDYQLVVAIKDLNMPENAKEFQTGIKVMYNDSDIQQSDIELLSYFEKATPDNTSAFVKNGLQMEPLPYNFYGRHASSLIFYNEFYNTDKALNEDFMVSYSVYQMINGESELVMIGHKRQSPAPILPFLMQMDISKLHSGNYQLNVELRSRTKELLSKKSIFFQRSNPLIEEDGIELADVNIEEEFVNKLSTEQLEYSLRALTPKMPQSDVDWVNSLIRKEKYKEQRLYLFSYWIKESPNNPEFAYKKYMEVASAIDKKYNSGFRHGFETDRGYYYLKYGQPDDIELRDIEPSAPPYEVWVYYEFPSTNQNNVKFVFYNPSLAPGDFELLHSTAIGERNNPTWQRDLYREVPNEFNTSDYFGDDGMMNNFNRNADRVFRDY